MRCSVSVRISTPTNPEAFRGKGEVVGIAQRHVSHQYLEGDPHALCIAQEQLKARDAVEKAKQRAREAKMLRRQEEESAQSRLDKINSYMEEKVRIVRPRRRRLWLGRSRYAVG